VPLPASIADYLRGNTAELAARILDSFPPLHSIDDPPSPIIGKLLRKPYPAQTSPSWVWSDAGSRPEQVL